MIVLQKILKLLKKPPGLILERLLQELVSRIDKYYLPFYVRILNRKRFLKSINCVSIVKAWEGVAESVSPFYSKIGDYEKAYTEYGKIILSKAEYSLSRRVDLLGTGLIGLGENISWNKDYKTNISWGNRYFKEIDYSNLDKPSDVKIPWEISRLQWCIPVGQAYLLTGDERYAEFIKEILLSWIEANPCAYSINWACTMEAAMRIFTWTWFFHVFKNSKAWEDEDFRFAFIKNLYLHGKFTERYIEKSDVNGNHYLADLAGLVFVGLFFKGAKDADRWFRKGWGGLQKEIDIQVFSDGVDYEVSVAYHRLVTELFFFSAFYYKSSMGKEIPDNYKVKLKKMAEFIGAYSREDGTSPLVGDADDARVLPFGTQQLLDHRYLVAVIGLLIDDKNLLRSYKCQEYSEIFWLFGENGVEKIKEIQRESLDQQVPVTKSKAFSEGGFFVLRNDKDHVFIDCGPVGLKGRGGHGHNDILSFEAMLNGEELISDCGSYVYTASFEGRNKFRSTAFHNTPQVDDEEINRFISPLHLWNLQNDVKNFTHKYSFSDNEDGVECSHDGYSRIDDSLKLRRTFSLEHKRHALIIVDSIASQREHKIVIPLHLSNGVDIEKIDKEGRTILLNKNRKEFIISWVGSSLDAECEIDDAFISPSYGKIVSSKKIIWSFPKVKNIEFKVVVLSL